MNQTTYRMRRRVGAALLAGVSALGVTGVAALAGEGVANAATPTVVATTSTNPSISGNASTAFGTVSLAVSGAITAGDHIVLTITCPSTGVTEWDAGHITATDSSGGDWMSSGTVTQSGNCVKGGTSGYDTLTLVAPISYSSGTTITLNGMYTTVGAPSGAVSVAGTYAAYGSSTTFAVPTNATVSWFTTTSNVPNVTTSGTSAQSVSNVTISQPSGLTTGLTTSASSSITLTLTGATFAAVPTFSAVPSSALSSTATVTQPLTNTATASFTTSSSISGANFTFSGLSIDPTTSGGPITAAVTYTSGATSGNIALSIPVATEIGTATRYYGYTADQTVATEFEAAFPVTSGGVRTAVISTDVDPYDALSASYLAGQLGTGVLIVPQSGFTGSAAAQAIQLEGITSVYIVGGPLAVPASVRSQITSTPAYNPGGVTQTGSNLTITAQIYGQTADGTAQRIATYFGTAYGTPPAISGAYNTSGGVYNDTTGSASTTGPTSSVPTAFVISDTDWRDATTLGPIAYAYRIPIILTQANYSSSVIGPQAQSALTSLGIKQAIVVGGQLAFPNAWVTSIQGMNGGISVLRIAGQDYTDTATELAKFELGSAGTGLNWNGGTAKGYLLSHGDDWPDALGAASIAGNANFDGGKFGYQPILTTENPTTVGQYLQSYASSVAPSGAALNVLGGPLAVTPAVVSAVQTALAS